MYNDIYSYKPPKAQITLVQILTIVLTILIVLVLPIEYITYTQKQSSTPLYTAANLNQRTAESKSARSSSQQSSGQVAGAETVKQNIIRIPLLNIQINLGSEADYLTLSGGILIVISLGLSVYLTLSSKVKHTSDHD